MGNNHSRPRPTYETRKRCKYPFLHWRRLCHNDAWCKCDARRLTKGWTSGHPGLDKFIKETQRSTREWMDPYLVWIPYDQLSNIKTIGEGGFSITYSAEWCDMAKRFSWAVTDKPRPVALRLIKDSKDMSTSFIEELRVYHQCISNPPMFDGEVKYDHGFLRFFGFTQHPETRDYLMVTELAPCRDIRYLLQKNFLQLCWSDKLYWLRNIAGNLVTIHESGYAHRNLHPGNILMGQIKDGVTVAKLAHLGLSRPATNVSSKDFYGVLPYIAPEVLLGQQYTKSADIYSIGIIMVELSSGIPPFVDRVHDEKLALEIVNGLRPEFAEGTPTSYIELAQQCFKSNPSDRPKARDLLYMFNQWWDNTQDPEIHDDIFCNADKIIPALDNNFIKHPEAVYTSRLINFKRLLNKGKEDIRN